MPASVADIAPPQTAEPKPVLPVLNPITVRAKFFFEGDRLRQGNFPFDVVRNHHRANSPAGE